jgi:hypothetical protein
MSRQSPDCGQHFVFAASTLTLPACRPPPADIHSTDEGADCIRTPLRTAIRSALRRRAFLNRIVGLPELRYAALPGIVKNLPKRRGASVRNPRGRILRRVCEYFQSCALAGSADSPAWHHLPGLTTNTAVAW